ncbi:GtrA family protein [Cellulomonas sp.]|uniref:GtrA family protein n=1 Tax=Cellulomonas sp. TaxID=40001 RepID=UPI003BA8B130
MDGSSAGRPGSPAPTRLRALLDSEGLRFVLVGGVNTVFGFGIFALLQSTLGTVVHYLVVLVVAQVVAVLEAYVLQRYVVFRARGRWWRDLVRFSSVYAVAFAVNAAALPLLVEVLHMAVIPAQAVVTAAVALGTFLVHRNFTFRHSRRSAREAVPTATTRGATPQVTALPTAGAPADDTTSPRVAQTDDAAPRSTIRP